MPSKDSSPAGPAHAPPATAQFPYTTGHNKALLGSASNYRELKHGLGLDHFEGRTYLGWHRHVTLTALAQAFCTMLRLDPKAHAPA